MFLQDIPDILDEISDILRLVSVLSSTKGICKYLGSALLKATMFTLTQYQPV